MSTFVSWLQTKDKWIDCICNYQLYATMMKIWKSLRLNDVCVDRWHNISPFFFFSYFTGILYLLPVHSSLLCRAWIWPNLQTLVEFCYCSVKKVFIKNLFFIRKHFGKYIWALYCPLIEYPALIVSCKILPCVLKSIIVELILFQIPLMEVQSVLCHLFFLKCTQWNWY